MGILRWLELKRREFGFSRNFLLVVAMVSMLIDHIGFTLIRNGKLYGYDLTLYENAISLEQASGWLTLYRVCRMIGRISFPIYAFLIVEGFRKTSNIFKYILRILLLALISEIPFDLMVFNELPYSVDCLEVQNVLFTYFVGLLMLLAIKAINFLPMFLSCVPAILATIICYFLKTDYWLEGIMLIYVYYIFRHDLNVKCLFVLLITFFMTLERYYGIGVLSVFFIYFYDGQKGYLDFKRLHYIFYPLHMLVLYGIVYFSYFNN